MAMRSEGLIVIFSAPSGTGKGTIMKELMKTNKRVKLSVSSTTRKPRAGEEDGKDYFFKSVDQFKQMIEKDELIEWVEYCGNYYGTPKEYVEESVRKGNFVILEIEVEGALRIMEQHPDCVSIFVLPPSFEELRNRIVGRGTEKCEIIEQRLQKAKNEVTYINRYDYVVVNDNIDNAVNAVNSILKAEMYRYKRNSDILSKIGL